MTNYLMWAGGVAGALLAVGSVLRAVLRRLFRASLWAYALSSLPGAVDALNESVTELTTTVADLSRSVDALQHHSHTSLTLESL